MELDRLEVDRVMEKVRGAREKVRGAREKVKELRVEAKKADASRRRNVPVFQLIDNETYGYSHGFCSAAKTEQPLP